MSFLSADFILFLPAAVLLYYLVPRRLKPVCLLAASYLFYACVSVRFVPWLLAYTVLTFFAGRLIAGKRDEKGADLLLGICLTLLFTILLSFKYLPVDRFSLVMPAGLSFFTFEAAGYLIDVRRGRAPEDDPVRLALFLSFFPQLLSGPIARSSTFLPQLDKPAVFSADNLSEGAFLMLWGYFMKRVAADRAALFVNQVYGNWQGCGGLVLAGATALYALQVYCDFYGYSTMALGAARLFGIRLQDNFTAPFLSRSIGEFWRRWHNSLTGWFRDYLYIPLGGNRKGRVRKYLNIMIVFLVSGMWHGNTLNYAVWGALNGFFIVLSDITKPVRSFLGGRLVRDPDCFSCRLVSSLVVFAEFCFTLVFFRMESFGEAIRLIRQMLTIPGIRSFQESVFFSVGEEMPNAGDLRLLLISAAVILFADWMKYRGISVVSWVRKQEFWFRDLVLICGALLVLFLGVWGESFSANSFVYVHF